MLYRLGSVVAACEAQFWRKTIHHAIFTGFTGLIGDWIDGMGYRVVLDS